MFDNHRPRIFGESAEPAFSPEKSVQSRHHTVDSAVHRALHALPEAVDQPLDVRVDAEEAYATHADSNVFDFEAYRNEKLARQAIREARENPTQHDAHTPEMPLGATDAEVRNIEMARAAREAADEARKLAS